MNKIKFRSKSGNQEVILCYANRSAVYKRRTERTKEHYLTDIDFHKLIDNFWNNKRWDKVRVFNSGDVS